MELKNSIINKLFDDEISVKKSAANKFAEKIWMFAKSKLSTRYGYSIDISDSYLITVVNNFIKSYDARFESRNVNEQGLLYNTTVTLLIDENTLLHVQAGNPFDTSETTKLLLETSNGGNDRSYGTKLKIYLYGKYAKKHLNILKSKITKKNTGNLRIFNISANSSVDKAESFQSIISDLTNRDLDTLFYDGDIKEQIKAHIDGFFKTKDLYQEKNINYKTSLLLYGPPGSGKSSLANAICNKYGIDMVLIDLNSFDRLDANMVTKCINGDDKTYLVLIEDIDTVFNVDRNQETLEKDDKKVVNKLLQFLDSNSSPNNVIFICTTNHIEKLDAALLRRGRIDKNCYIGPITKEKARVMCESFEISEDSINKVLSKFPEYTEDENGNKNYNTVNQSTLQGEILDQVKAELAAKAGQIMNVAPSINIEENPSEEDNKIE